MKKSTLLLKSFFLFAAFLFLQSSTILAADYSVKFIRVIADQVEEKVLVRWATDSEINNSYFTVQRSIDGGSIWQDLGIVDSYGGTPGAGTYKFVDQNPIMGSITYRLRQTDYDGTYSYSFYAEVEVTAFTGNDPAEVELQVYPNPSDDNFITIDTEILTGDVSIQLMDLSGKKINVNLNINDDQIQLSPVNKIYGLYFLLISDRNKTFVEKIKFE